MNLLTGDVARSGDQGRELERTVQVFYGHRDVMLAQ